MPTTPFRRRTTAVLAGSLLAVSFVGASVLTAAAPASADPIGTLTFNGLSTQDTPFSVTTSGACPTTPTLSTYFMIRVTGGDLPIVTPPANITGTASSETISGGITTAAFTAAASNTLRNFASDQGLSMLGNGTYTVELVCREKLRQASLGEFVGTFVVSGNSVETSAPVATGSATLSGDVKVGGTAVCLPGTWTGATSYTYEFLRNGVVVQTSGTDKDRVLAASDLGATIACRVTGTNALGSGVPSLSAGVKVGLGAAPKSGGAPTISGKAKVGKKLSASKGTWRPAASYTYTYRWKRNGTVVSQGVGRSTYKTVKKDKNKKITVTVLAARTGYATGTATSKAVKVKG